MPGAPGTNNTFLGLLLCQYRGSDPAVESFARDVRENFQRLMFFIQPPGTDPPSGLTTCRVVTGFSGSSLTTVDINCFGFTSAASINLDTETVVISASAGTNSLSFSRKDLVVFSANTNSATVLSGTNCS